MSKTAVFTISSINYFGQAKTLLDSLKETNPEWDRYFALVDEKSQDIVEAAEGIEIIEMSQLDINDLEEMKFRYDVMELNTAIKPFVFLHLFKQYDRVIYLDPDICVYREMSEINNAFDEGYRFVLTPHFTGYWKEDGKHPDEPDIMRAGIYNFGFFAAAKCDDALEVIRWWADKLRYLCVNRQTEGIFVDQKWMDLLPARHDKVFFLRHNGYNTAYWNLQHRTCEYVDGHYYFNGDPLVFFHFSGFNPEKKNSISKHQNRFEMSDIGAAVGLFDDYAQRCLNNGYTKWRKVPYSYNHFSDGTPIPDVFRYIYRDENTIADLIEGKNPFECSRIFDKNKDQISRVLINYICKKHPESGNLFFNCDRKAWIDWFITIVQDGYKLDDEWVKCITEILIGHVNHFDDSLISEEEYLAITQRGVNLIGYIKSEHGLGEACRLTADALAHTKLSWTAYDWEMNNPSRQEDTTWDYKISKDLPYNVSIFNINADQMAVAKQYLPEKAWQGYRIGIWYWELTEFPEEWCSAFDLVDEIWAPTRFIQDNLQKIAPCPVIYMPPGISRKMPDKKYDRAYFELPENAFLFLNMFDAYSYSSRKNPSAAIEAFQMSFKPDDMTVGLVLKINNISKESKEYNELVEVLKGYQNIYIIPKTMTREEINGLINTCDVSVSLHRSEGLGLLCEESMFFGKPVIATNWSGNTDFMTENSACLVDYTLVPIGEYYGTNAANQFWAEAKVDHASRYMLRLREDREYYREISRNAKKYIYSRFSSEVCGKRMEEHIREIYSKTEQCLKDNKQSALAESRGGEEQTHIDLNTECAQDIQITNTYWEVNYDTVPLGRTDGLKGIIKRFIRKMIRFMVAPLVSMQREYNAATTRILNSVISQLENGESRKDVIEAQLGQCRNEVGLVKNQIEEFDLELKKLGKIEEQKEQIVSLKEKIERIEEQLTQLDAQKATLASIKQQVQDN